MKPAAAAMLVGASALAGSDAMLPPVVPWWGQLLISIVSVVLAFFSGRVDGNRAR